MPSRLAAPACAALLALAASASALPAAAEHLWPLGMMAQRAISYAPAADVPALGRVLVFTSPRCPFCRRMHGEIDAWLEAGIEVAYLPLPIADLDSGAASETFAIWCQDGDRRRAFDRAIIRGSAPQGLRSCAPEVEEGYRVLVRMTQASATPTLVLPNGISYPGTPDLADLVEWMQRWRERG